MVIRDLFLKVGAIVAHVLLTKSGWGEVGIRFVILLIVVNNKIYVICFVV